MGHRSKRAFSLVEVLIALLIVGAVTGPLLFLLSTTNKEASGSLYKIMAAHFANEIAEQLLIWQANPGLAAITQASGKDVKTILEELNAEPFFTNPTKGGPQRFSLGGLRLYLLVSPLHDAFQERRISVEELTMDQSAFLLKGTFYKVTISVGWKLQGETTTKHFHESVLFLRVDA